MFFRFSPLHLPQKALGSCNPPATRLRCANFSFLPQFRSRLAVTLWRARMMSFPMAHPLCAGLFRVSLFPLPRLLPHFFSYSTPPKVPGPFRFLFAVLLPDFLFQTGGGLAFSVGTPLPLLTCTTFCHFPRGFHAGLAFFCSGSFFATVSSDG